ncbi:MAG: serine protease [Planctomycetota bacterium]
MPTLCRRIVAPALLLLLALQPTLADPWIAGVTPRLIGRGTTSEIVIAPWRHEASTLLFYPHSTADSVPSHPSTPAAGIRCINSHFDPAKQQLTCQLEVTADCRPGEYPFRVLTAVGLSSMGTVHVSPFPVIDEAETNANSNDSPQTAITVSPGTTVRGTLSSSAADDIDCFRIAGRTGERLSIEVDMVKMGDDLRWNPIPEGYDTVVAVLDPSGKRIAVNDDSSLNRQDPLLSIRLPLDGNYTVVLRRSMFVPEERAYAIHLGSFFRPLAAYPPGGPAGRPLEVQLLGDPLGTVPQTLVIPEVTGIFAHRAEAPLPLLLRSSPFPNLLETPAQPVTTVPALPCALNGILATPDETDRFQLTVTKGQTLQVRVWASALGSAVDPSIRIRPLDAAGNPGPPELESDDASLADRDIFGAQGDFPDAFDPSVIWTPKTGGNYLLELWDPRGAGGPNNVYRIEVAPPVNALHIGLSWEGYKPERPRRTSLSIPRGSLWTVRLSLYPGQGSSISGPLQLGVEGLPEGLHMTCPPLPGLQSVWPMTFSADNAAPFAASLIQLTATSTDPNVSFVTVNQQNLQRVSYSHYPWRNIRVDRFAAAVSEPAGFSVELDPPTQPLMRGSELTIPVRIIRQPDCDEPLEMQCELAPPGVGVSPAEVIPAGATSASLTLSAEAAAKLGTAPLYVMLTTTQPRGGHTAGSVSGDSAQGAERIRVSSPVVSVEVAEPFVTLASEPQFLRRGERLAYRWSVKQVRPFPGKARVRMLGLPVGILATGPEPTIDSTSTEVSVELEATDDALLGLVSDLKCDVRFAGEGAAQEISLRTGAGKLRIDPRLAK